MPSADTGGRKQLSAARDAQSERWRITLEARQVVRGYFSQLEEPTGEVAKSLLVVPGAHACLSNIDSDGRFIRTMSFWWQGRLRTHQKGHSAGRLLAPYRAVRDSHPELFANVSVMSQPAANVDAIIFT